MQHNQRSELASILDPELVEGNKNAYLPSFRPLRLRRDAEEVVLSCTPFDNTSTPLSTAAQGPNISSGLKIPHFTSLGTKPFSLICSKNQVPHLQRRPEHPHEPNARHLGW